MSQHGESMKTGWLIKYGALWKKYGSCWPGTRQPETIIGVDVGSTAIKTVQMVRNNSELILRKIAHVPIRSDRNDPKMAAFDALKESLMGMDLKGARIVGVVNCPQTCVRTVTAPSMPSPELTEAIRWEVKNYIPFPLEEAIWDYEIATETAEKGVKKWNITVAASPRQTIDNLLYLFSQMEINVSSIVPISVVYQNIVRRMESASAETLAVIECGAFITELNIYQNASLVFSRKLSAAGKDVTESLTTTLVSDRGKMQLDFQQAEEIKRKYGMTEETTDQWVEGKISTNQILSLVRPRLEQLVGDIESSLDFYREESHGGTVNRILLFGGGSFLKGLAVFLNQQLGIKVEPGYALEGIKASADIDIHDPAASGLFAQAIGAAAGEGGGQHLSFKKNINHLPVECREKTRRLVMNVSLKVVITALIVMVGLFYMGLRIQVSAADKKLKAAQWEYQSLRSQMEELGEKARISRLVYGHPAWEEVFRELSNILPVGMYLTELEMKDNVVILKGIIHQSGQDMEVELSHFMLTLENGIFKNVQLIKTQKVDSSSMEFEILGGTE